MYAQQYIENDLLDKSPVELIRMLYSKAIEKLQLARQHTGANEVRERNACLARVMEIVAELQGALNPEAGGDVAVQLARLYDYVQRQLIDAVSDPKSVAQLEEVRVLLGNLHEGWQQCEPLPTPAPQPPDTLDPAARLERGNEGAQAGFPIDKLAPALAPADYPGDRVWTL
jgi:flagellar protein FliS